MKRPRPSAEGRGLLHRRLSQRRSAITRPDLERYAAEVGMNVDALKSALDAGTHKPLIAQDQREGQSAGNRLQDPLGTPSVFLNGRKYQGPRGYNPDGLEAVSRVYLGLE